MRDRNNSSSVKRQRTGSRSVSPPAEKQEPDAGEASDDEMETSNGKKSSRISRHQREKSEKEDRERQRLEAANKRKGRAERRRGEGECFNGGLEQNESAMLMVSADSDLSEEMPLAAMKAAHNIPAESPSKEDSPATGPLPGTPPAINPTAGSSHKRGPRSNRKGKGKNQYTKDRDLDTDGSPARSMSRDIQKGDEATTTGHSKSSVNEQKTAKAKAAMANKMSMLDMKRRVAAIMEFISRTQVDLAAEDPFSQSNSGRDTPQKSETVVQTNGDYGESANGSVLDLSDDKHFKDLNCVEMMDVLTRDMVKWQNQYAI